MTRPRSMTRAEEQAEFEAIQAWLKEQPRFRDQPQDAQQRIIRQVEYISGYRVAWREGQLVAKGLDKNIRDPDLPGASIRGLGLRGALCIVYAIGRRMQKIEEREREEVK